MPKGLRNNIVPLILIALVIAYAAMAFARTSTAPRTTDEASFNTLVQEIKKQNVKEVVAPAGGTFLRVQLKNDKRFTVTKEENIDTIQRLRNYGLTPEDLASFEYRPESASIMSQLGFWIFNLLPVLLILGLFIFSMRRAQSGADQAFSFGRSRAKRMNSETPVVTFADVAGCEESKFELVEVVDFLKNPEKFIQLGARIPKGVLLVGPPGTGKTLLAKATAGEAGVPFFTLSGSEFVELFVGVGASRVRDLFDQAKKAAPCIIFIDEIDAVGRQRGGGWGGGNDEREQTLNQMLVEMDGFSTDTNVIVIAATNRADTLDPALLRPGRFDRRVMVDVPDISGREAILKVHAKGKPISPEVELNLIAKQTPGFTGADLENLINESAILAARAGKKEIMQSELQEAIEKVALGPERRSRLITPREKEVVAYHEAGHAVAAAMLPEAELLMQKVTIIPRGMAGGVTWFAPEQEESALNMTRKKMEAQIVMTLAGRAAEDIVFNDVTAGAVSDLERASGLARAMVRQYGMSDTLGPISFSGRAEASFMGREFGESKPYSDKTAEQIDHEVTKIIRNSYERSKQVLLDNKDKLMLLAKRLLDNETVDANEFKKMMAV
ncbi:MAG: ATP-dependent zinc metalloprotease FtsH [Anaerolineae bacterium]|nr:ATP-dependent zinc metalloprotease FtsH [Anaerolineae bacterium]